MTKQKIYALLFIILAALDEEKETPPLRGVPNGHLYTALMTEVDIDQWNLIIKFAKDSGLLTESGHLLRITPKGEELEQKLTAIYAGAKLGPDGKELP